MEWLSRYRAHNDKLAMRLQMNKISERCPHCGAPAGTTCAEWNQGLELKNGCPPRESLPAALSTARRTPKPDPDQSGAYVPAQQRIAVKLIVSRIHRVAARLTSDELRTELYALADEIEARLESQR